MVKAAQLLLLILTIVLNPAFATEPATDSWPPETMPECHSIDCGMAESEPCSDDCSHLVTSCCSSLSSAALSMSESTLGKKSLLTGFNVYRDNYLSIVPPPLFHPPRQVI